MTTSFKETFIARSRELHGDKYDYSHVNYTNKRTKVCIVCRKHGAFYQSPSTHLRGPGCPKCKSEKLSAMRKSTKEEFIEKARKKHGDKFDYSHVNYTSSITPITIICPIHGVFKQRPDEHLTSKYGCGRCGESNKGKHRSLSIKDFIAKATAIHGSKYDYSQVQYIDTYVKVCIICPTHGPFLQRPNDHLTGHGCKYCRDKDLIYGVAVNDTVGQNQTKAYKVWQSMF